MPGTTVYGLKLLTYTVNEAGGCFSDLESDQLQLSTILDFVNNTGVSWPPTPKDIPEPIAIREFSVKGFAVYVVKGV